VGKTTMGRAVLAVMLAVTAMVSTAASQDCDVRGVVETPPDGATITEQNVIISGWAADLSAASGSGVQAVRVALDADPDQGGVPLPAQNGWERPDVAALLGGPRYSPSGFALTWNTTGVPAGSHTLYVQVRTACGWTSNTRTVSVATRPGAASSVPSSPGGASSTAPGGIAPTGGAAGAPTPAPPPGGVGTGPPGTSPTSPGTVGIPGGTTTRPGGTGVPGGTTSAPGGASTIPGAAPTTSVPGTSPLPAR
jgi:hypothetical protein